MCVWGGGGLPPLPSGQPLTPPWQAAAFHPPSSHKSLCPCLPPPRPTATKACAPASLPPALQPQKLVLISCIHLVPLPPPPPFPQATNPALAAAAQKAAQIAASFAQPSPAAAAAPAPAAPVLPPAAPILPSLLTALPSGLLGQGRVKPTPLRLDAMGREVDERGHVINRTVQVRGQGGR